MLSSGLSVTVAPLRLMRRFISIVVVLLALCAPFAHAETAFLEVLRAQAATFPVLTPSTETGSPKFTVVRFNEKAVVTSGERYGAIRVVCPADKSVSLAWMFSDVGNIDEYDFIPVKGGVLDFGSNRHIYPATAHPDPEQEQFGRLASALPRPWDLFELHMLGVPAKLLKPGEEYLIWFRFSDRRPTDVLLAVSFLDPALEIATSDLPPVFGLPLLPGTK